MRGQVLWFNPKLRRGLLVVEGTAQEVRFYLCDFQGGTPEKGDCVTFDLGLDTAGRTKAIRITPSEEGDDFVRIKVKMFGDLYEHKDRYARPKYKKFW